MSNPNDFVIQNGTLVKYTGPGGDVVIPDGVTKLKGSIFVGMGAFSGNTSLTGVTIPSSMECIGEDAFNGCSNLKNVIIPSTVKIIEKSAFSKCSSLSDVTIPNGVTKIGNSAFYGCSSLKTISIPDSVTEIGGNAFQDCRSLTNVTLPKAISSIETCTFMGCSCLTDITIPDGVTSIGDSAFTRCNLERLTIPNSVLSIGRNAFTECTKLTSISIPHSLNRISDGAFSKCYSLTEVILPSSIVSIGLSAFSDCSSMSEIIIPESVTDIGRFAFMNCTSLKRILISDTVMGVGRDAFSNTAFYNDPANWEERILQLGSIIIKADSAVSGEYIVKNDVTCIAEDAFKECGSLVSVTIPGNVKSIGDNAFTKCDALERVDIQDGVKRIGHWAFWDCKKLSEITIPDSITCINGRAFSGCSRLTELAIPKDLTSIEDDTFYGCVSLSRIAIPDRVTSIGYEAFSGCRNLAEAVIPDSVTSIAALAFQNCSGLKNLKLPANLRVIENRSFSNCSSLTEVTIPKGVTKIGNSAFYGCSSLEYISIPDGVTAIDDYAFAACKNLTSLAIPESVSSFGEGVFSGCNKLEKLTVSKKLKSLGKDPFGNTLPEGLANNLSTFYHTLADGSVKQYILTGRAKNAIWAKLPESQKADIFLSRQGKSLTGAYLDCIGENGIASLGEALLDKLKGELSAKECNAVVGFMTMFSTKAPGVLLNRLYQALKSQKNGKKAVDAIESNAELTSLMKQAQAVGSSTPESKSDPFVAMMLANKVSAKEAELSLKEYYSLNLNELPVIEANDGRPVPSAFVAWLMTMHEEQHASGWSSGRGMPSVAAAFPPGLRPEASEAVSLIDGQSLQKGILSLADRFLDKYVNTKKKYLTFPICRYADEATMTEMTKRAPSWSTSVSGSSAPPLGEFRSAVCYSNTRAAMLFAERFKDLSRYAWVRGTDVDTIRDRYLSDVGLDVHGCKIYDLGNQIATAKLQKDLGFLIELPDGKTAKSLPKKGADPAKYELANADFSEMKKSVKRILKNRGKVLFEDFLSGRSRKSTDWQASYLENPLLHEAASLLVWAQGKNTFTLSDSGPIDSYGKAYTFSDTAIKVAHPMEMEPSDVTAWQKYYAAHGLKQPFAQIWEPVIDPDLVKEDRYAGCLIPYYRFSGQEKHGITVEDEDFHNLISINFEGCQAEVERIDWERHNISPQHRFEIKQFTFDKFSRQVNHIVTYLDQVTVWDRIRKDDVSAIDVIDRFTLAQIVELIKTAQEAKAVNVLALLLEYKNTHFAEFDPMEEFSLEW